MQVLESTVNPQSDDFRENAEVMEAHTVSYTHLTLPTILLV